MNDETQLTLKQAILDALVHEMAADASIVVLGEDVGVAGGVFKQTEGLFERFGPTRVIDTPISEAAVVGMAVGAAMTGLRPLVEIMFGDFVTLGLDAIANQAAKIRYLSAGGFSVPMVLRTAVGVGGSLGAQHSQSFHAWFAHVPGLKVVMPATAQDGWDLMRSALRDGDPVVFVEDRQLYNQQGPVRKDETPSPLGRAAIVRAGQDMTLIAIGRSVRIAVAAAEQLEGKGLSAEVINLRSVQPLDLHTMLDSARRTARVAVIDAAPRAFGITAEIAAIIGEQAFGYLDAPVLRIGAPMVPVPFSPTLERLTVPSPEQVVAAVIREFGT